MPAWPASIRFIDLYRSLRTQGPQGDVASFMPDVGPPKTRRRTTASYRPISGETPPLTKAELAVFEAFWETDLAGGVLDFTATHPLTGSTATFRPTGTGYRLVPVGAEKVRVALSLYEVPA